MTLPRDEGEYISDTEASGWAIGAVLSQIQDSEERIVSYGSRLYSKAEEHYSNERTPRDCLLRKVLQTIFVEATIPDSHGSRCTTMVNENAGTNRSAESMS